MRELVSKLEGGCMSVCFHVASRSRTRAEESYRMAVGLSQAKVHISRTFDWFLGGNFAGFWGIRQELEGLKVCRGFDSGGILTGFKGFLAGPVERFDYSGYLLLGLI